MHLNRLTLSHFRSHHRTELEVDPRPIALFGPNGAGKTNILEAVSMLSPGRGLRRAGAEELIRRPEALGWKVTALVQAAGQVHEIETFAEPGQPRQVKIDGKAAPLVSHLLEDDRLSPEDVKELRRRLKRSRT